MKRALVVVLVLILVFSFTACREATMSDAEILAAAEQILDNERSAATYSPTEAPTEAPTATLEPTPTPSPVPTPTPFNPDSFQILHRKVPFSELINYQLGTFGLGSVQPVFQNQGGGYTYSINEDQLYSFKLDGCGKY